MQNNFGCLIIGGGSAGVASAIRAAKYGVKVALIESGKIAGTCVNSGCVPKKVMWNAALTLEILKSSSGYGIDANYSLNWKTLKENRENYVERLHEIYLNKLKFHGVEVINGVASFTGPNTIVVNGEMELTAPNIFITSGSKPLLLNIPGKEFLCTSDDFFLLDDKVNKALIVGNGYIAGEISGLLSTLGTDTTVAAREPRFLETFDIDTANILEEHYRQSGINIFTQTEVVEIKKTSDGFEAIFNDGRRFTYDLIISAIGRIGNVEKLNLQVTSVELDQIGNIKVDEWEATNAPGIYAFGDVIGKKNQTPVAVAAGRKLADRLFGNKPDAKLDYNLIPTMMFSMLPVGTIGLTEKAAREKYGDAIKIYKSKFTNMFFQVGNYKEPTLFKMIVYGPEEKIIGLHAVGRGVDEMIQGFAVAIKMGARKQDFDDTVAIHPTASEEFVLLS
ncbi:unnamed protein product [Blepharisma stoltei]|uniref:Glutathione-disulfide reductase n=1 Tax=Blepharisma stoltei TaxID=1481888 RepID=A0AAU9JV82_9CILI|nr:unnamed protein product [Blepharisma stoltei]